MGTEDTDFLQRECWRLQGYEDSEYEAAEMVTPKRGRFRMPLYKQAGNSIPTTIFYSMFEQILLQLKDEKDEVNK